MKKLLALASFLPIFAYAAGVSYISEPSGDNTNRAYNIKCTDGTWDTVIVTNGTVYASTKRGYLGSDVGVSKAAKLVCR